MGKKKKIEIHDVKSLKNIEEPIKGDIYQIPVNNPKIGKRIVAFEYTGKSGFGKWKTISNVKA